MKAKYDQTDRSITLDPAEAWEAPYTKRAGESYFDGITSYPKKPGSPKEVPEGALEGLREPCGIEDLHQVLVLPWAVRFTDFGDGKVITPNSVLALGTRAVGLWTEEPEPGVKACIPLGDLAAIEDVTVLLYGRLGFVSRRSRVTVRYNTVARELFEPALIELRKRLAGPAGPIPRRKGEPSELPFKWNNIVSSSLVRLQEDASVAFRFVQTPAKSRRALTRSHLLVLNPWELVYVKDPLGSGYGADRYIFPRSAISDVRISENRLAIVSNGADFSLGMMPELRDAAVGWFSGVSPN